MLSVGNTIFYRSKKKQAYADTKKRTLLTKRRTYDLIEYLKLMEGFQLYQRILL
ncbi:unnamed protein product (macronuclear) [Paramecium tetraurelia]|uniref:Uncharacterized protein n=1 Tax=Paramecium tetraurelia TaxID=5888 RepID=A0E753_PARTE|nr:uncharacterized protein GSPATT00023848001 [Paramecium tetraurelia]CAK91120.1 unnamed protein product [Paramecium tetraurelia]|eukprot:XP_001458517.1 hypothetical protein (macronuclear) [Paramecium tetraurelia strain d4-2]